jgi:hypothetical protein
MKTIINEGTINAVIFTTEPAGEMFRVRVQRMSDSSVPLGKFFGSVGYATYPKSSQIRLFYTEQEAQAYVDKRIRFDAVRAKKI